MNNTGLPDNVLFRKEAKADFRAFDNSQKLEILKAIRKVSQNPAPKSEGGYGKPLGGNLTGYLKIKLRSSGIRIVYEYIRRDSGMDIVVIALREDDAVYEMAVRRLRK